MSPSGRSGRHAALGTLMVLGAAAGFSVKSIIIKLAYGYGADATSLFALRQLFSAPFFAGLAWWSGRNAATRDAPGRRDWVHLVVLGLLGYYLAAWLDFLGLRHVSASLERLILFLHPTVVLLLSAWWLKTPVRRAQVAALGVCYAGIVLVFIDQAGLAPAGDDLLLGSSLVFASAVAYAVYLIGSSRVVHRFGAIRFTSWAMLAATVVGLTQFAWTHGFEALRLPAPVYGLSAVMAVCCTVLPALLMSEGLRRVGATQASLIGTIGPVLTMALGVAVLDERMGPMQLLGAALVVSGVALVSLRRAAA